jgi:hypothetical protein
MVQVGADASGLELRMLGHYLAFFDGGRFADIVVNGDIHQINADAVGVSRKAVKSITYCFIYGGGDEKLGMTTDPLLKGAKAKKLGSEIRRKFTEAIPGLDSLLKAVVKKAVGQHESAKHKGEGKTELKLKSGGRCKKEGGNVRKYKKGGEVIGMKKTAADKKDIAGIKKKGSAPKKQAPKTKQMDMAPAEFPMEGELPMFQMGGGVPVGQGAMSDIDRKMMESERRRKMARTQNAQGAGLNPGQMAQFAGQEMQTPAAPATMGPMGGMGGGMGQAAPTAGGMGQSSPMGPASDTDEIMQGLRQLGKYAKGGCV